MNRRSFLRVLAAGTTGFALDPERLLWRPGARTFFLPTPKVVDSVVVMKWITLEEFRSRYASAELPTVVTYAVSAARPPIVLVADGGLWTSRPIDETVTPRVG